MAEDFARMNAAPPARDYTFALVLLLLLAGAVWYVLEGRQVKAAGPSAVRVSAPSVAPLSAAVDLRAVAREVAIDHGIPPRLFSALIQTESSWRENARGAAGERCLTQLMPAVAAALGVNPDDPLECLQGGARHLRKHYRRTGDWSRALAAYNGRGPRAEAYAQKVLRAWEASE